jgi:hypothetical protein
MPNLEDYDDASEYLYGLWDTYKDQHINYQDAEKILKRAYRFNPYEPILKDEYFITQNGDVLKHVIDVAGVSEVNFICDFKSGLYLIDLSCFHEEIMARIFAATKNINWKFQYSDNYVERGLGVYKSSCSNVITISKNIAIPDCLKHIKQKHFETI